ncbi:helix-turn-helix domain-containing protein [Zhongshania borealis]|uniref:HTH luxR-type domain-containing protein n=1 Tax=Zhongshania borealis TaxID=889488 RepID=A0ABP7X6J1_9GAMM
MKNNKQIRAFVSSLYRGGAQVPVDQFKPWALQQLRALIPFDAAIFACGNMSKGKFHNATVLGLQDGFTSSLEKTADLNPLYNAISANLGSAFRICDVVDDETYYQSKTYHRCFQNFGVERILSSAHADMRTRLYTLLSLYRFDRDNDFSEEDKATHEALSFHLVDAYSHVYFLHLTRPKSETQERFAAVVDGEGVLHEAQAGFAEELEEKFQACENGRLPFAVQEGTFTLGDGNLQAKTTPLGDLYMVEIWDEGPLDRLTSREREVVDAVCRGLSDKEVAIDIGLAPTTVSSHLYHAYKKLGVTSRRELRQLIQ